jgi:putative transposase
MALGITANGRPSGSVSARNSFLHRALHWRDQLLARGGCQMLDELVHDMPPRMRYDNAVMESFFASLKQELTHHERFVDRDTARSQVFDCIESFYNRQRLHSSLDYRSPEVFESMARVTN